MAFERALHPWYQDDDVAKTLFDGEQIQIHKKHYLTEIRNDIIMRDFLKNFFERARPSDILNEPKITFKFS